MGVREAEQLQQKIDEIIAGSFDFRIVLDADADVVDLASNVAVRVFEGRRAEFRVFSIVTTRWLYQSLEKDGWSDILAETKGLYCTGGPLIVARDISADVIVRAVRRYLLMEAGNSS